MQGHIRSNYIAIGLNAGANHHGNNTITPHENYGKFPSLYRSNYIAIRLNAGQHSTMKEIYRYVRHNKRKEGLQGIQR